MNWLRSVLQALSAAAFSASVAAANGSAPQNGACFELADEAARLCVPVRMKLIEVEVDNGRVWASFEEVFLSVTVNMWSGTGAKLPHPDSFEAALSISKMAKEVYRHKKQPRRWAFSSSGACTVLEVEIGNTAFIEFFSEISCPAGTLQILVTDFSPEFDDVDLDYVNSLNEMRLLTNTQDDILAILHPYNDMERAYAQ